MRTRLRRLALLTAGLWAAARPGAASLNNTGADAGQFLQVGAGARALGMGDAYGPVAEGPDAMYWNPAGLAQSKGFEASLSHTELLSEFHHEFIAFDLPVKLLHGTLGASFSHFWQDPLPVISNTNAILGSYRPYSDAVSLGYAHAFGIGGAEQPARDKDYLNEVWNIPGANRPLDDGRDLWVGTLMAGAAIKVVNETVYDRRASAIAFDGGVLYRPSQIEGLSLDVAFRNMGSKEKFNLVHESLPMEVDAGAAYDWRPGHSRLLCALEVAVPYYGPPYGKLGVEYSFPAAPHVQVSVRAGYKTVSATDLSPLSGFTGGFGTRYRDLDADLAYQPMASLGGIYRMSLGYRW